MKQISILGCGWLGFPLAENLINKGNKIKGTTTSVDKLQLLSKAGIVPYLISISSEGITNHRLSAPLESTFCALLLLILVEAT